MMPAPCFNRACAASGARRLARCSRTTLNTSIPPRVPQRRNLPAPPPIAIVPTRYSNTQLLCSCLRSVSSISTLDDDVDEVKLDVDGDACTDDDSKLDTLKFAYEHLREFEQVGEIPKERTVVESEPSISSKLYGTSSSSIERYSKSYSVNVDDEDASELDALTNALQHVIEVEQTYDKGNGSASVDSEYAPTASEDDTLILNHSPNHDDDLQIGETAQRSKPSLSELLQTDIFTKSWAEPDREESIHRRSELKHGRRSFRMNRSENRPSNSWTPSSGSAANEIPPSTSWHDDELPRQHSLAEIEYNKILEQTNKLLEALTINDDSSTLQLRDFDKVMTQWSRFHVENSNSNHDGSDADSMVESLNKRASDQCMKLLDALERNYDSILDHAIEGFAASSDVKSPPTHYHLMPNAASYNLALNALANSGKGQHVASEARSMLLRMLDRCQNYVDIIEREDGLTFMKLPPPPFEPTSITFNSTLHAIAKSRAPGAGHLAEQVSFKMHEWRDSCNERKYRHGVIDDEGMHVSDATDGETKPKPQKDLYSPDNNPTCFYHGVVPNPRTLACVIDAWANTDASFAPERAEAILQLAINRRRAYVDSLTGRRSSDHLSKNYEHEWSDAVLEDLEVEEQAVDEDLELSLPVEAPPPSDVESLTPSLKPNTVAFNTCIHSWATSGKGREGALRAQELLLQLESLSESGELDLPIDHPCGTNTDGNTEMDTSLKPNVRTYSMVMNAWANVAKVGRESGLDAASRCEDILMKMEVRGAIDSSIRPNLVAYVTSISAWANTKGVEYAASKAENILNRMIDLYYNEDTSELPQLDGDVMNANHDAPFNSVITAYARSSDTCAAERALAVLERLEASPIQPSTTSYNAVLDVCAKHGEPDRALEILDKMKTMSIPVDTTSYDTILNAFAKHDKAGSAERAYDFLRQLEQSSSESQFSPSAWSYATVINAFARASGKDYGGLHAVEKAKEIYNELVDKMTSGLIHGEADCYANSCLLNCCANIYGTRTEKRVALVTAVSDELS